MAAPLIFDRRAVRRGRERAARLPEGADFLRAEVAARLVERLRDVRRPFAAVLELGARRGELARALAAAGAAPALHVATELAPAGPGLGPGALAVAADEEALPFRACAFDAALSVNTLHLANDLPGVLAQARDALRPDGLFLAAFPGGATLGELRWCLTRAELEATGGAASRVAPFVDVRDAGALLQRAGFALPMADLDRIEVVYRDPLRLFADLRAMGETGCLAGARRPLPRAVLARALELWAAEFGAADGAGPRATFEVLFLAGWRPAPGQPKPAPRGGGSARAPVGRLPPGAAAGGGA